MANRLSLKWKLILGTAAVFLVAIGALVVTVRVNDTANLIYKRYKTFDRYVFEEVRPELAAQDARSFISVSSPADVKALRREVSAVIYENDGDRTAQHAFYAYGNSKTLETARNFNFVKEARQYYVAQRPGVLSFLYILEPETPNPDHAVIFHDGFAGSFVDMRPMIEAMVKAGYLVVAMDQFGYGENSREAPCEIPEYDLTCEANLQYGMAKLHSPLSLHVEPVRAAVDFLESKGVSTIDAVGFSAGSGTVVLAASVEPRIRRSVAVAGTLPYYLREGQDAPIGVADYAPLKDRASLLDLYILGASGEGRAQMHLFNRFDRCCFRNLKGRQYEGAVQDAVQSLGIGGGFGVSIDETHARHTISDWGVARVMDFLNGGAPTGSSVSDAIEKEQQ
ncbi:alpha/beta hydrolase [Rhodospirillaceae bacterium KN72]|uniref:Alpha/beta hydrolase n=1 Tax=Pacificispira spongiicola TaxID=2729598 RepID=A0A7Y0HEH4_9PROT|nr:alpha/beta fold hydrolase [Pacificispira spongiicola]NMM43568.1 alpha/beta hydrolase [Pacificispira spongiicola]